MEPPFLISLDKQTIMTHLCETVDFTGVIHTCQLEQLRTYLFDIYIAYTRVLAHFDHYIKNLILKDIFRTCHI